MAHTGDAVGNKDLRKRQENYLSLRANAAVTLVGTLLTTVVAIYEIGDKASFWIVVAGLISVALVTLLASGILQIIDSQSRWALFAKIGIPLAAILIAPYGISVYTKLILGVDLTSTPESNRASRRTPEFFIVSGATGNKNKLWIRSDGFAGVFWFEYHDADYTKLPDAGAKPAFIFRQIKVDTINGRDYIFLYDDARAMWFWFPLNGGAYRWQDQGGQESSDKLDGQPAELLEPIWRDPSPAPPVPPGSH